MVEEVERALEGEIDAEQVEQAIADAKAAAAKLREEARRRRQHRWTRWW